jgi:hypothetical protein
MPVRDKVLKKLKNGAKQAEADNYPNRATISE